MLKHIRYVVKLYENVVSIRDMKTNVAPVRDTWRYEKVLNTGPLASPETKDVFFKVVLGAMLFKV